MLDNLQHLLDIAIRAEASEKESVVRELVCKVEEVHVTLQKHLRKEEEQLFPLVLEHFTFEEQADLVVRALPPAAALGAINSQATDTDGCCTCRCSLSVASPFFLLRTY